MQWDILSVIWFNLWSKWLKIHHWCMKLSVSAFKILHLRGSVVQMKLLLQVTKGKCGVTRAIWFGILQRDTHASLDKIWNISLFSQLYHWTNWYINNQALMTVVDLLIIQFILMTCQTIVHVYMCTCLSFVWFSFKCLFVWLVKQ